MLEFVSHLVVANTAFIHACLQLLVYSLTPPPTAPIEGADHGPWKPSEHDLSVQATVLQALNRVSRGELRPGCDGAAGAASGGPDLRLQWFAHAGVCASPQSAL